MCRCTLLLLLLTVSPGFAQPQTPDPGKLTLDRIFASEEFRGDRVPPVKWLDGGAYTTLQSSKVHKEGSDIVQFDATGGLKGNLLLVHGSGDDNCHAQGMEKLADRLIELNKPFTLMAYPNRSHSIDEGKTTSRHLYGFLTRYLNDNLLAGPK